jgi:cytochrome b
MADPDEAGAPWEIWVGLFVAAGMIVTIGWAVFETYWG